MRKDLLALGTLLLFFGLVFVAISRVAIRPEPTPYWVVVEETWAQQPSDSLFVQGTLKNGDRFRANFRLAIVGAHLLPDVVILVNITDPNEHTESFEVLVPFTKGAPKYEFPEHVANFTGTYKVTAQSILPTALLSNLALQKMEIEEEEPQYPHSDFMPVGVVVLLGGFGILFLGVKLSKRRRTLYKRRLQKRKIRS